MNELCLLIKYLFLYIYSLKVETCAKSFTGKKWELIKHLLANQNFHQYFAMFKPK